LVALGVRIAGGEPVAITAKSEKPDRDLDGVILGGGQDVFPMLFDDTPKQGYVYDRARDEMEISLAQTALERDVPVLAICRGAQLLNVAYGGTLHLDMTEAYEDAHYPDSLFAKAFYRKPITTVADSIIRRALGVKRAFVNSLHKQSVKELGDGLRATAVEPNGVIQAIEDANRPYVLGVQFHPEFMLHKKMFRQVFGSLINAAQSAPSLEPAALKQLEQRVAAHAGG
jgi:putative glutamine amidotransferase